MIRLPTVQSKTILLSGGLDLETPQIAIREGFALEANNIESNLMGGYRKIQGYERVDGRSAPSDAVYYLLSVDDSTTEAIGTSITGSLSGASADIVEKDDTINALCVTNLSGSFVANDVLNTATVSSPEELSGHADATTDIAWEYAAQEFYRALILPVPGAGDILGVWQFNGVKYAFRNNGGVVKMFASSLSGWVEVIHFQLMQWDTGILADGDIVVGDTLTGLTSSATGIVKNFIKVSGSYGANAVGYMVIDVTSGTFVVSEEIQETGVTKFTSTTAADDIEFTLGDHDFRFVTYNFHGSEDRRAMYGCDGVNRGFSFDGTVLTPIVTGMAIDAPIAIEAHFNQLFFAFKGGSLQHSAPTTPLIFNPILGAAELSTGDGIRGLKSVGGEVLLVSTDRAVSGLYGSGVASWQLNLISIDTGDIGNTLDVIGTPIMTTNRGIVRIDATEKYGNFESSTISRRIRPLLDALIAANEVVGVNLIRDKNQYRLYFSDGKGVILTSDQLFGDGGLPQFTTFEYLNTPTCLASIAVDAGEEVILFGATDGFVYQEEKGFNFDGQAMNYTLKLPFHHLGSPTVRKAFKWVDVEIDTTKSTSLRMTYEYSDGQDHTATSVESLYSVVIGVAAKWGDVNWGDFLWDSQSISRPPASLDGTGHNISLFFFGLSATDSDFTVNSLTYQYINRRRSRG